MVIFCTNVNSNFSTLYTNPVPPVAKTNAIYGQWQNPQPNEIEIISITSNHYETVELHDSILDDYGIMRMRKINFPIKLGANRYLRLEKGGKHLMLLSKQNKMSEPHKINIFLESGENFTVAVEEKAK